MKKVILTTLLCASFSTPALALTAIAAVSKLQSLRVEQLKNVDETTTLSEADMKAQDDAFDTLEEAVNASIKDPANTELNEQILKVASVLLKKDPTQFAGEVILPFYEKNRKGFDAALKSFSAADSAEIMKAVKAAAREKARGNG